MEQVVNFIYQHELAIRLTVFISGFTLLAVWEWRKPKRKLSQLKLKRWFNNIALMVSGTILVRILLSSTAVSVAYMAEKEGLGLSSHFEAPFILKVIITFVLLDLAMYLQHSMFHALPVFWRFHRVHHSDLDNDITTGIRFHPLEILLSILIKFAVIIVLGAPVLAVILFETALNLMSMFTHSNIRLNNTFEKVLRWFIVTPDMHRIHHSILENETNSNFSFNISLWDRIFSTYLAQPSAGHQGMTIGLSQFREESWQNFSGLIKMPFYSNLKGYAINNRDTINEDELALAREVAIQSQEKERLASELSSYVQAIDRHALVSVTDIFGKILHANDKFCKVSGYSKEELIGEDHRIVNSGAHPKNFWAIFWAHISSGKTWHGDICNRNKSGEIYWVDTTIAPIKDVNGEIERYVSVRIDITEQKKYENEVNKAYEELAQANHKLQRISRTDGLTKIANRRYFDETLTSEISKLSRTNMPLTLILCDIDYFKNYNDFYGHVKGDDCLQQVAQAINSSFFRDSDLVARYGGEEFSVILSNVNEKTAIILAERLRSNIEKLKLEHEDSTVAKIVTISIGVTTLFPDKDTSSQKIIENADKALYIAKNKGRNNVQFFKNEAVSSKK